MRKAFNLVYRAPACVVSLGPADGRCQDLAAAHF